MSLAATLFAAPLFAAEKVAVVSIKPTEQLVSDIRYLMRATGTEPFEQMILPQLQAYFQGINGKQPIGVVLTVDEAQQLVPLAFVPVTDLQTVLQQFAGQLGEPEEVGDGVLELQGPQPVFIKEQNGWAFIGQSVESLSDLPANPAQLLEGLEKNYLLGVRLFLKNLPAAYKEMAVSQLQETMQGQLENADDPEQAQKAAEAQIAQLKQLMDETETLTLGWQVDSKEKSIHFDGVVKALPDTKMAKQIASAADAKTRFGGFLVDGAAIQGNLTSALLPDQIDEMLTSMDQLEAQTKAQIEQDEKLDDSTRNAAKQLVNTFFQIGRSTVKTGNLDSAMSVILKPDAMTLVAATHVASGADVESAVKQLVAMAQKDEEFSFKSVKLNAAEHAGVRFHTMEVPIPQDEYVRKVVGETLQIVVGAADESAYVAIGNNGLTYLKQLIDASSKSGTQTVDPFELEIALQPILDFAKSVEPNPIVESLAQMLANKGGKDHLRVRTSVSDQGALYRLTLEEGVLSLLGQGILLGSQGGF
jgi:hypothetical protein